MVCKAGNFQGDLGIPNALFFLSSTTIHQSSPNSGPCTDLLNFMSLLSAHFSSQEEFSIRQKINPYFVTDSVLENAIFDRACYSPSLSVHLGLPARLKSLILIFLSCRFPHQAFLMPFRHYTHKMNNSYSLYYSGPWHWCIGNTIFLLFTSFSALISFILDMEVL